jgi:hypothetical protein
VSGTAVLKHPLWWLALALLLMNDHVLKGSGFLPSILTGKLSDFAGLVVAPCLLAAIVGQGRARKASAFAVVAVVFAAINVSPACADATEAAAGRLGLSWRIWCDPTDLVALLVLPLSWRLSGGSDRPRVLHPSVSLTERVAVLVGAFACVATSEDYRAMESSVFVVNATRGDVLLQVFRSAPLDCALVAGDPSSHLTAEGFAFERCKRLKPFKQYPLDQDARILGEDAAPPPPGPICDAVVLRAAGMDDTLVFWHDIAKQEVRIDPEIHSFEPGGLYIEQVGERLVIERSEFVRVWPAPEGIPDAVCPGAAP